MQYRVATAVLQRFQNTALCSPGIGAAPQQAENRHFRDGGNADFLHLYIRMHCLPLMFSKFQVDLFRAGTVSWGRKQRAPLVYLSGAPLLSWSETNLLQI